MKLHSQPLNLVRFPESINAADSSSESLPGSPLKGLLILCVCCFPPEKPASANEHTSESGLKGRAWGSPVSFAFVMQALESHGAPPFMTGDDFRGL